MFYKWYTDQDQQEEPFMTNVSTNLLAIQHHLNLTTKEMAEKLGISENELRYSIENPTLEFIELICSVFGVSKKFITEGAGLMSTTCTLPVTDILAFREARNWKQFHTPKDLAISLSLEAAELLECFQWSGSDVEVKEKKTHMEEELADILIYSVLFADAIGADIPAIIKSKLAKNGQKYTVEKAFGNAKKYTDFTTTE